MGVFLALLFARLVIKLFLGKLRPEESEVSSCWWWWCTREAPNLIIACPLPSPYPQKVADNLKFAIPEMCLALAIFREELSTRVFTLFGMVLLTKFFHWVTAERVDRMDAILHVSRVGHTRLVAFMALLVLLDVCTLSAVSVLVLRQGPSVLILVGFEFALLLVSIMNTFTAYILYLINSRVEGRWHNRVCLPHPHTPQPHHTHTHTPGSLLCL